MDGIPPESEGVSRVDGHSSNRRRCKHCQRGLRHSQRCDPLVDHQQKTQGEPQHRVCVDGNASNVGRSVTEGAHAEQLSPDRAMPASVQHAFAKRRAAAGRPALRHTATNILTGWRATNVVANLSTTNRPRVEPSEQDLKKFQAIYDHGVEMQQRRDARMQSFRQSLVQREKDECPFRPHFVSGAVCNNRSPLKERCQDFANYPYQLSQPNRSAPTSQSAPNLRLTTGAFTKVMGSHIHGDPQVRSRINKTVSPPFAPAC